MRKILVGLAASSALVTVSLAAQAQPSDPLADGFRTPPPSAQPRVWWHWLNGNITEAGIDQDLAWMKRQGIGGVQNFDGAFREPAGPFSTPTVVAKPLDYMTPDWQAAFKHAVTTADGLGMDFGIASSPGWSESGGPWVQPQAAMKKLVWSELQVEGGHPLSTPLPAPPSVTGPFQGVAAAESNLDSQHTPLPSLYRDAVVVAFRAPAADLRPAPKPQITASSPIDTSILTDGALDRSVQLPFAPGQESWIQFDYGAPQTVRALRLAAAKAGGFGPGFGATSPAGRIEISQDGRTFSPIASLPVDGAPEETIAFPAVTARYFRVSFLPRKAEAASALMGAPAPTHHDISELAFETGARVHRFEDKAGWSVVADLGDQPTPTVSPDAVVRRTEVVDLTSRLKPDGQLDWTPPPGRWIVLRLGYSLIGTQNHPASPTGTGLEVDKLSREHVRDYVETYLGLYDRAVGPDLIGRRGVREMVNDSWEAGAQNWTENLIGEFRQRRGYDPTPFLPVLTGRVVESAQASDAFLWDFRRTLGEMLADNHYGEISNAVHARGMTRYGESHESGRAFIGDGMEVKKSADVPMSATWAENPPGAPPFNYDADVRESASVAHLYGQNLVAAESFTTAGNPFGWSPANLKPIADRMMANGLNRFVIHTSVHQPIDTPGPGMTLAVFGQWFTRKETWAEQARPWMDYLARSSHLLQQGRFAADIAWLYPEDGNITALFGDQPPQIPAGYAYDYVNADALVHLMQAQDGKITTPSGMSYRVLAVDPRMRLMSVAVLRKLHELADAGVVIVGDRPQASPSLADDPAEFNRLADAVFGPGAHHTHPSAALAQAMAATAAPDLDDRGAGLRFVHRMADGEEIYFVSNPGDTPKTLEASFRTSGHAAEIWRADTGKIAPASYRMDGDRTSVSLDLAAHDAEFVVFRRQGPSERAVPATTTRTVATLQTGWRIRFPSNQVAHGDYALAQLTSWSESQDPEVRYFSGTACYSTSFQAPPTGAKAQDRLMLDLGEVHELAAVSVNGKPVGIAWKPPYRLDISSAVHAGANTLQACVTNLWPNRLIGDKQPNAPAAKAFTTYNPFPADAPLRPSGLFGPVTLVRAIP